MRRDLQCVPIHSGHKTQMRCNILKLRRTDFAKCFRKYTLRCHTIGRHLRIAGGRDALVVMAGFTRSA